MSQYVEKAKQLRSLFKPEGGPVYNCAQAVVCVFADDIGHYECIGYVEEIYKA